MAGLFHDVRYALRLLRKTPGFTTVAVAALALGIGANSAIFSLVDAVLLRPLPYKDPGRLVLLSERTPQLEGMSVSWPNYVDWKAQTQAFETFAARQNASFNLTGIDEPERLEGSNVTANFFDALGVRPALGRPFLPEEDKPGGDRVVVISDSLWERRFGRDRRILGQALTLDGVPYTVVGVMPPGFRYPAAALHADIYASLGQKSDAMQERGNHPGIFAIARLKPDISIAGARADMDTIARRLEQQYPDWNESHRIGLEFYQARVVQRLRTPLLVLLGAVGFVLLIACANVANLLLARAAERRHEISVRTALGAGRGQLVRQLLVESVTLSAAGGMLGLVLAWLGLRALIAAAPEGTPRLSGAGIDLRILGFTILLSVVTGLVFGVAPALQISRGHLHDALKDGARRMSADLRRHRLRAVLVVSEVALSLILLVGAGLMLRSFSLLAHASPGFNPQGVLTLSLALPETRYRTPAQRLAFFEQLMERTRTLPGAISAGLISPLPLGGSFWQTDVQIEGHVDTKNAGNHLSDMASVTPDYFRTMGVPLLKGRVFTAQDNEKSTGVAIVDETFARTYFPNEEPLGKRLLWNDRPIQIVGIVGHVKNYGVDAISRIETYVPFSQMPVNSPDFVVRTSGDPTQLAVPITAQVRQIDPNQPVYNVRKMDRLVDESIAQQRLATMLLGVFAALAVALSAIGLYGVIAYSVTQRTQEIGIRMALGAGRGDVLRLVAQQTLGFVALGLVIGVAGAFVLTRSLEKLLFGVKADNPATFAAGAVLLGLVSLAACYVPARQATRVDPMIALRHE